MDRFLVSNANKRPCSDGDTPSSPANKKPRPCAKQGNVTAAIRVALPSLGEAFSTLTVANFFADLVTLLSTITGNTPFRR